VIPSWLRKQFNIEDGTKAIVQATPEGILFETRHALGHRAWLWNAEAQVRRKILQRGMAEHKREERELEEK